MIDYIIADDGILPAPVSEAATPVAAVANQPQLAKMQREIQYIQQANYDNQITQLRNTVQDLQGKIQSFYYDAELLKMTKKGIEGCFNELYISELIEPYV